MAAIKPEFGTSGFFTTTPLMGIRTLLDPKSLNVLSKYCEEEEPSDENPPMEERKNAQQVKGMEISGSNGRFMKDGSTKGSNSVDKCDLDATLVDNHLEMNPKVFKTLNKLRSLAKE